MIPSKATRYHYHQADESLRHPCSFDGVFIGMPLVLQLRVNDGCTDLDGVRQVYVYSAIFLNMRSTVGFTRSPIASLGLCSSIKHVLKYSGAFLEDGRPLIN